MSYLIPKEEVTMHSRRRAHLVVVPHPQQKSRAMLKCAISSPSRAKSSRANSLDVSPKRPTISALSPTLWALLPLLQTLEKRDPLTLASLVRVVRQELGSAHEATGTLDDLLSASSTPAWGWHGRK